MLNDGKKMYAYPFVGYWKDVGTIDSLWEANMDLLGEKPNFNIHDKNWRIFSRNYAEPPHFVGEDAKVVNSMITEGCEIEGTVENSVLSNGVKVEKGAIVKDAVIMSGAVIKANAKVIYSIIDSNTVISSGAVVGEDKSTAKGIAIVGSDLTLAENLVVEAGAMVNSDYGDGVSVNEN